MKDTESWCKKALESCADRLREKVTEELKKSLEIHSPSKEWPQAITAAPEQKEYRLTILGTVWTLREAKKEDDPGLENCDGYTDRSTKTMVVQGKGAGGPHEVADYQAYLKDIKRHEIIHAFLYESGLAADFEHTQYGHEETMVDWIALQFPKMLAVFQEADAI